MKYMKKRLGRYSWGQNFGWTNREEKSKRPNPERSKTWSLLCYICVPWLVTNYTGRLQLIYVKMAASTIQHTCLQFCSSFPAATVVQTSSALCNLLSPRRLFPALPASQSLLPWSPDVEVTTCNASVNNNEIKSIAAYISSELGTRTQNATTVTY